MVMKMAMIENPYELCNEDCSILENNPIYSYKTWENSNFDQIKSRIRNHIITEQHYKCPYCRMTLRPRTDDLPIDHIVPRQPYALFMFEMKNLVLTCDGCNHAKLNKKVLVDDDITEYPENSNAFIIFHPYFDNYEDHLCLVIDELFIKSISDKGDKTIEICKLDNVQLAFNRAREKKINQVGLYRKLMYKLEREDDNAIFIQIMALLDAIGNN